MWADSGLSWCLGRPGRLAATLRRIRGLLASGGNEPPGRPAFGRAACHDVVEYDIGSPVPLRRAPLWRCLQVPLGIQKNVFGLLDRLGSLLPLDMKATLKVRFPIVTRLLVVLYRFRHFRRKQGYGLAFGRFQENLDFAVLFTEHLRIIGAIDTNLRPGFNSFQRIQDCTCLWRGIPIELLKTTLSPPVAGAFHHH